MSITAKLLFNNDYTEKILLATLAEPQRAYWCHQPNQLGLNMFKYVIRGKYHMHTGPTNPNGIIDSLKNLLSQWNNVSCRKQFYDILHANITKHAHDVGSTT